MASVAELKEEIERLKKQIEELNANQVMMNYKETFNSHTIKALKEHFAQQDQLTELNKALKKPGSVSGGFKTIDIRLDAMAQKINSLERLIGSSTLNVMNSSVVTQASEGRGA